MTEVAVIRDQEKARTVIVEILTQARGKHSLVGTMWIVTRPTSNRT